jgi:hypothetical protein
MKNLHFQSLADDGKPFKYTLFVIRVARFLLVQCTKTGQMYQMTNKCTKWPIVVNYFK